MSYITVKERINNFKINIKNEIVIVEKIIDEISDNNFGQFDVISAFMNNHFSDFVYSSNFLSLRELYKYIQNNLTTTNEKELIIYLNYADLLLNVFHYFNNNGRGLAQLVYSSTSKIEKRITSTLNHFGYDSKIKKINKNQSCITIIPKDQVNIKVVSKLPQGIKWRILEFHSHRNNIRAKIDVIRDLDYIYQEYEIKHRIIFNEICNNKKTHNFIGKYLNNTIRHPNAEDFGKRLYDLLYKNHEVVNILYDCYLEQLLSIENRITLKKYDIKKNPVD